MLVLRGGLWRHVTRPISFTLVVDDFGIKYTNKEDVDHLIKCLKENYDLTQDWDGDLLRDKIEMELRRTNPRHINAGIYSQTTPEI